MEPGYDFTEVPIYLQLQDAPEGSHSFLEPFTSLISSLPASLSKHTHSHVHACTHAHANLPFHCPALLWLKKWLPFKGVFCLIEGELTYNVVLISAT